MKHKDYAIKIIKVVVFALLTWALYVPLTYLYRGVFSASRSNLAGWYAEEEDSLDVVILGTSPTFSAIMPLELWGANGITSYDMCVNVLLEDSMKYYVREITKTQDPELLIIDTASFLYGFKAENSTEDEGRLRYNTDGLKISKNRFELIREIVPQGERLEYYFDLFYYHGNTDINYYYIFNSYPNEGKGFVNLQQMISYEETDYMANSEEVELPESDKKIFLDLLEELKGFDGEILFLEQPVFYTEETAAMCGYSEYMERVVKEYGYDYLDLSKVRTEIGLDSVFDYSLDYLHFTSFSAEKITAYLSGYLSDVYELPDHREDTEYQDWADAYQYWIEVKAYHNRMTESQIAERFQAADFAQYMDFLNSEYYSSCVYFPEQSTAPDTGELMERLSANGVTVELENESDDIRVVVTNKRTGEIVDEARFVYNEAESSYQRE